MQIAKFHNEINSTTLSDVENTDFDQIEENFLRAQVPDDVKKSKN